MTIREVSRRLLDAKMRGPSRALLLGYIVMVRLYGWQGFGLIGERTVTYVKARLKQLGISPDDLDV